MKKLFSIRLALSACAGVLAFGCSKDSAAPPKAVSAEQAPATLQETFKETAPAPVKELATDAGAAFTAQDYPRAVVALDTLSLRSDISRQQREAAVAALMAANKALEERAGAGDKAAQAFLARRRATK